MEGGREEKHHELGTSAEVEGGGPVPSVTVKERVSNKQGGGYLARQTVHRKYASCKLHEDRNDLK